ARQVRRADEPARATTRPERHALCPPGRSRRSGPCLQCPRRDDARPRADAEARRPQDRHDARRDDRGRSPAAHVERPARRLSGRGRREDGAHGPGRRVPTDDLAELMTCGLARFHIVDAVSAGRVYASARTSYGKGELDLVAPRSVGRALVAGRALVERIVAPMGVDLAVRPAHKLGGVRVYERGKLVARSPLVAGRSIDEPGAAARAGWYVKRTAHNMWG